MALALNTGHALYANIVALICVDGGVLKDLKTPGRTFTVDSNADYDAITKFGTGTYGEHFRSWVKTLSIQGNGVTFSPALAIANNSTAASLFLAVNNIATKNDTDSGNLIGSTSNPYRFLNIAVSSTGKPQFSIGSSDQYGQVGSATIYQNGAHSLALTEPVGDTTTSSQSMYVDGALDGVGGIANAAATASHTFDRLGGSPGFKGVGADFVYVVWFDIQLTAQQISDLHASLTGYNSFALVTGASVPSGVTASGTISGISLSAPAGSATGTAGAAGTIVTPVLKNNTGQVLANESGVIVNLYNTSTGALVLHKTGQASNASGIVTVSDALIVAGTSYVYEVVLTGSRRRLPVVSAS